MKELIDQLSYLKKDYNIAGIKQSFEDEGVTYDDVVTMRRITELCGLPLFVKIGICNRGSGSLCQLRVDLGSFSNNLTLPSLNLLFKVS